MKRMPSPFLWLFLALGIAACSTQQKAQPLSPPVLLAWFEPRWDERAAAHPAGDEAAALLRDAIRIEADLFALDALPEKELEPLAPQIELITTPRGGTPILPVSRLAEGTRIGSGAAAEALLARLRQEEDTRVLPISSVRALLPAGATQVLHIAESRDEKRSGELGGKPERAEVHLSRAAPEPLPVSRAASDEMSSSIEWSLVLEGEVAVLKARPSELLAAPGTKSPARREEKMDALEQIYLKPEAALPPGNGPLLVLLRFRFQGSGARCLGIALRTTVEGPGGEAEPLDPKTLELWSALPFAEANPGLRMKPKDERVNQWESLEAALAGLADPARRRNALDYLAGQTSADLARDMAAACTEDRIRAWAKRLQDRLKERPARDEAALRWTLERTAFETLAEDALQAEPDPNRAALLILHAGELGRAPALLLNLIGQVDTYEAFQKRVRWENCLYLDDPSPAARVRAFDWLSTRGTTPKGYDPLDPSKERRAALRDHLRKEQEATPSEEEEGKTP